MDESQFLNSVIERLKGLGLTEIKTEVPVSFGARRARADIVIENPNGSPFAVGEVKNKLPSKLDRFHPAVTQAFSYANVLGCKYFFVADSETMSWYEIKKRGDTTEAVEILPNDLYTNVGQKQMETQIVRPSDWASIVWKFNAVIDDSYFGFHRAERINLFLFFLLMKKFSTKDVGDSSHQFYVIAEETPSATKERLDRLAKFISSKNLSISFERYSRLDKKTVQKIAGVFEPYDLVTLDLPRLYQEVLIPTFVKSEELQFATRPEIVRFVLATNDFLKAKNIIDPASGIGSFLISAFEKYENKNAIRLSGIDKLTLSVETLRMALLLCNAENFNLENGDFLSDAFAYLRDSSYDFVFCDPPFGGKYSHTEPSIDSSWDVESPSSLSSELLFTVKVTELLSKQGVAMMLLPTTVLQSNRWRDFRKRLVSKVDIIASISWANAYGKLNIPAHLVVFQNKSIKPSPTMFVSLTDDPGKGIFFEDKVSVLVEIYNHYRETGRIKKLSSIILPVAVADTFTQDTRLDYAAYDAGYKSFLDQLLNSPVEVVKLSEIANIDLGHINKSSGKEVPGKTLIIRPSNITYNGLLSDLTSISMSDTSKVAYVEPGDILLANLGSSSPIALIPENFPKAAYSNSLLRIRLKNNAIIDPRYLYLILNHEVSKTQLEYLSTGATIRRVTPKLLGDLLVPILPKSDQEILIAKLELLENHRKLVLTTEDDLAKTLSKALGWEKTDETQP